MPPRSLGTIIDGRFQLESVLGAGGMGIVYQATDLLLQREVALKVLNHGSSTGVKRFERERQVLAGIKHPGVPEYYSCGMHEGAPYMVMELLFGQTLEAMLRSGKASFDDLRTIFIQVCSALTAIHCLGIVHRDIKPSNIMVCTNEGVIDAKLMDLGIAFLIGKEDQRITATDELLGSFGYLSPEHLTPNSVEARSDVFQLGCVMYRAVAESPPFARDTVLASMVAVKEGKFRPLPALVPESLRLAIYKCIQSDPSERFQSAEQLQKVLSGEVNIGRAAFKSPSSLIARKVTTGLTIALLAAPLGWVCIDAALKKIGSSSNNEIFEFTAKQELLDAIRTHNSTRALKQCKEIDKSSGAANYKQAVSTLLEAGARAYQVQEVAVAKLADQTALSILARSKATRDEVTAVEARLLLHSYFDAPGKSQEILKAAEKLLPAAQSQVSKREVFIVLALATRSTDNQLSQSYWRKALNTEVVPKATGTYFQSIDDEWWMQYQMALTADLVQKYDLLQPGLSPLETAIKKRCLPSVWGIPYLCLLRTVPYSIRKENLTTKASQLANQASEQSKDGTRILYKLLGATFIYDVNKKTGLSDINRWLHELLNPHEVVNFPLARIVVESLIKTDSLPNEVLPLLLSKNILWLNDYTLYPMIDRADAATQRDIFRQLHCKDSFKLHAGCRLLANLIRQQRHSEVREVIQQLRMVNGWRQDDILLVTMYSYFASQRDVASMRTLVNDLKQKPPASHAQQSQCLLILASLLAAKNENSDEVLRLAKQACSLGYCQTTARVILCDVYRRLNDASALNDLAESVWHDGKLKESDRVLLVLKIANALAHLKQYKNLNSLIQRARQTSYWTAEPALAELTDIYLCTEDWRSLKCLYNDTEHQPSVSGPTRAYIGIQAANILSMQFKQVEACKVIDTLNLNYLLEDPRSIYILCEIHERDSDLERLKELYDKLYLAKKVPDKIRLQLCSRMLIAVSAAGDKKEADRLIDSIKSIKGWCSDEIVLRMGVAYEQRHDKARYQALIEDINHCSEVAQITRDCLTARLAVMLANDGDVPAAKALGDNIKRRDSYQQDQRVLQELERVYVATQDAAGLQEIYNNYSSQNRHVSAEDKIVTLARLAMNYARLHCYDEVCRTANQVRKDPAWLEHPQAVHHLLHAYEEAASVSELQSTFDQVRKSSLPSNVKMRAAAFLARCLVVNNLDSSPAANEVLNWVASCGPEYGADPGSAQRVAELYVRRGDTVALEKLVRVSTPRTSARIKCNLTVLLWTAGRLAEARKVMNEISRELETHWDAHTALILCDLYQTVSNTQDFMQLYRSANARHLKMQTEIGLKLVQYLCTTDRRNEATGILNKILTDDSANLNQSNLVLLINAYKALNDLDKLKQLCSRKLTGETAAYCRIALANCLQSKGQIDEAQALTPELLTTVYASNSPPLFENLCELLVLQGAVNYLKRTRLLLQPLHSARWQTVRVKLDIGLATLLNQRGQKSEATRILNSTVSVAEKLEPATRFEFLCQIYSTKGDVAELEKIVSATEKATTYNQRYKNCRARIALAQLLLASGSEKDKQRAGTILRPIVEQPANTEEGSTLSSLLNTATHLSSSLRLPSKR